MQNSKNSECGLHLYTHTKMWLIASSLTSTQLIYVAQIEQKKKKKKEEIIWHVNCFVFLPHTSSFLAEFVSFFSSSTFSTSKRTRLNCLFVIPFVFRSFAFVRHILDKYFGYIIWTSEVAVGVDLFDVFIKQSLAVCNQVMVLLLS